MSNLAEQSRFDADQYLAWEARQTEKHEFIGGAVFAMVGARREHVVVAGNLFAALKQRLQDAPCQVYISELKLRVDAADAFFYPDVMVSCDARDHRAAFFLAHPILIAEVLSATTAAFDRGDKFFAYRSLPSLEDYVLVDISNRRVEVFHRTSDHEWLLHDYLPDAGDCRFPSLQIAVPIAEIFAQVSPSETAPAADNPDASDDTR